MAKDDRFFDLEWNTQRENFYKELAILSPNWAILNTNDSFISIFNDEILRRQLIKAFNNYDAISVAKIYNRYNKYLTDNNYFENSIVNEELKPDKRIIIMEE